MPTATATQTAAYLRSLGFDLFESIDEAEAREHLGDEGDDGTYACIGQTDEGSTYGLHCDDPERAEIVLTAVGDRREIVGLLRALGWREVRDNYVQTNAFYLPLAAAGEA